MEANEKIKGIVGEVSLERNKGKFNSFSVTVGLTLKKGGLTYAQGERLITKMRKELLGKEVEISEISHLCPVCEKGFKTMQGMRQHVRMVHNKDKPNKKRMATKAKIPPKTKKKTKENSS